MINSATLQCNMMTYCTNESRIRDDIYPVATSHILIVLSRDADSTKSPAGTKATDDTLWSWPSIVLKHSNVCANSHNFIDMSALHEAVNRNTNTPKINEKSVNLFSSFYFCF